MNQISAPSVLKSLRALTPTRHCSFDEALQIAERQAVRLGQLLNAIDSMSDGIQISDIDHLPRIRVVFERLPVSGMSHWNGIEWIIAIHDSDSPARQRFTVLHEFKHILDHGHVNDLYIGVPARQTEQAADFFAGCALVPRRALKSAWGNGVQRPVDLANHFGVSTQAIEVRLAQTGLSRAVDPVRRPRCARPVSTPKHQRQQFRSVTAGNQRRWA